MPKQGGDNLKLKRATWWLDFRHNGERYRERIGKNISRSVAAEIAVVKRAAIVKGEVGIKKSKDLEYTVARDEFLKWVETTKKPNTLEFYRSCFNRLNPSFKGKMLSEISPFLIEKHRQGRVKLGHRVASNRELSALSSMFTQCIQWKKFPGPNPVLEVKKLKEPLNKLVHLSADEEARLLAALPEPQRTIVMIGLYMGLRIGAEVLTLKKTNVDLERKEITILAAYEKTEKTVTLRIHSCLVEPLRAAIEKSPSELLFPSPKLGQVMHDIRTSFENACKKAGITGVTPHTARHTFGSNLAMSGVNDRTMQKLGRWSDPKMLERYAHLSQEHLDEALEKIQPTKSLGTILAPLGKVEKLKVS